MGELRVIIAGGRDYNNLPQLEVDVDNFIHDLSNFITNTTLSINSIKIISGCANGADTLGIEYANSRKYSLEKIPAKWDELGRKAGFARNVEMAKFASEEGNYGALIAFWDGKSKGTNHMIDIAASNDLYVRIVYY